MAVLHHPVLKELRFPLFCPPPGCRLLREPQSLSQVIFLHLISPVIMGRPPVGLLSLVKGLTKHELPLFIWGLTPYGSGSWGFQFLALTALAHFLPGVP